MLCSPSVSYVGTQTESLLSQGKPVSLSSYNVNRPDNSAERAFDGNLDQDLMRTPFAHSGYGLVNWLEVDLQQQAVRVMVLCRLFVHL